MTIHKGFEFSTLGGMPLNQQRLEWMQAAYSELSGGLAAFFGNNVIVSGCVVSGNTVSDGWIVSGGELLPFIGTQSGVLDTFLVREARSPLIFKDGASRNVQFNRFAQFGTSAGAIAWNSLTRLPSAAALLSTLNTHTSNKSNPHAVTKAQVGLGNLPNAKTDDPKTNDSNILATSKMVQAAFALNNKTVISGKIKLNVANTFITVKISEELLLDDDADYDFNYDMVSLGSYMGGKIRISHLHQLRDVLFSSVPTLAGFTGIHISVYYDNSGFSADANVYFYYTINKRD